MKTAMMGNIDLAKSAGYRDGYSRPSNLGSGLSYDDQDLNEAYDQGVNAGQRARAKELGIVAECDIAIAPGNIVRFKDGFEVGRTGVVTGVIGQYAEVQLHTTANRRGIRVGTTVDSLDVVAGNQPE